MPWHSKGSKISPTEDEWLVCNMLDIVFCGVPFVVSIPQKAQQFPSVDKKMKKERG